jgi:choline dehydrogenase-like flavoprotein
LAADAVVVAAGALDSTRILLSSTSDDHPGGLGNSHGVLGRYVHDHPKEWWSFETERPLTLPAHPVYIPREDPAASPPLMSASHTIGLVAPRDRLRTFYRGRGNRFGVQIFGTMRPTDDMSVSLSRSVVDEFGQAALDIDMHYDDAVRENLRRARQRLFDTFAAAGNPVRGPDSYPVLEPGSSVHYGGTVRMHDRPEFGVLDRWNRVRDAPNVVVTDSSCFTTGAEKNPTLTAMAIAMRAADHLADELLATKPPDG